MLDLYRSRRLSSNLPLFSSVAGNGGEVGLVGGCCLLGQLHCSVGWVLSVCGEVSSSLVPESAMPAMWLLGNDGSMIPRSVQAS